MKNGSIYGDGLCGLKKGAVDGVVGVERERGIKDRKSELRY